MKHATSSFWFWLLIIGLFLILLAALVGGGIKEINGWIWAIFIVGAILAFLGIIFAIVAWAKSTPCGVVEESCENKCPVAPTQSPATPMSLTSAPSSPFAPTRVSTNIPQAQRGFTTTNLNLSALSN